MRKRTGAAAAALATMLILLSAGTSFGATLVFEEGGNGYNGTSDTTLYENRTSNAGGGFPYLFAGVTRDASPRRALIRFDLSSVPAGAVVTAAELRLSVDQSRPGSEMHSVYRVTRAWGEGSANSVVDPGGFGAPAATGDATWLSAQEGVTSWTVAGGDFHSAASASAVVGTLGTTATLTGAGLVQDVQGWLAQPATNHGWILLGNEAVVHNARRFHSSEGVAGLRPRLTLTISPPAGVERWEHYELK